MASSVAVCLCVFNLVVYVFFCCYWCQLDLLSVMSNYFPCCCNLYVIWPVVMIVVALPNDHPWDHGPPSSHWTTTVDPMGIDAKTCEVSLFVWFLPCQWINFIWCSSSLSMLTGFLSITGITPCTRWLNSSVARLGIPYPSGVVWICSNAMWMSPPESVHFYGA